MNGSIVLLNESREKSVEAVQTAPKLMLNVLRDCFPIHHMQIVITDVRFVALSLKLGGCEVRRKDVDQTPFASAGIFHPCD